MVNYSKGVRLAWEISCYEAANLKSSFIEVDHIMLGILSLDKIKRHSIFLTDQDFKDFAFEKEELYNTLKTFDINITTLRRKLREILPVGNGLPSDNIFHRSEDCKKMFVDADCLASNFLTINHLFLTIINWKTSWFRKFLLKNAVDIDKLKSDIMFSFYRKN